MQNDGISAMDFGSIEQQALLGLLPQNFAQKDEPEKVPTHVHNFYARMMDLLDDKGIDGNTAPAHAMKVLAIKEQMLARPQGRFGRIDRKLAVEKMVAEGRIARTQQRRMKNVPPSIKPSLIDVYLDQLPKEVQTNPDIVYSALYRAFGFVNAAAAEKLIARANRYMAAGKARGRLPIHIRDGVALSMAVMIAKVKFFGDTASPVEVDAVATLRTVELQNNA